MDYNYPEARYSRVGPKNQRGAGVPGLRGQSQDGAWRGVSSSPNSMEVGSRQGNPNVGMDAGYGRGTFTQGFTPAPLTLAQAYPQVSSRPQQQQQQVRRQEYLQYPGQYPHSDYNPQLQLHDGLSPSYRQSPSPNQMVSPGYSNFPRSSGPPAYARRHQHSQFSPYSGVSGVSNAIPGTTGRPYLQQVKMQQGSPALQRPSMVMPRPSPPIHRRTIPSPMHHSRQPSPRYNVNYSQGSIQRMPQTNEHRPVNPVVPVITQKNVSMPAPTRSPVSIDSSVDDNPDIIDLDDSDEEKEMGKDTRVGINREPQVVSASNRNQELDTSEGSDEDMDFVGSLSPRSDESLDELSSATLGHEIELAEKLYSLTGVNRTVTPPIIDGRLILKKTAVAVNKVKRLPMRYFKDIMPRGRESGLPPNEDRMDIFTAYGRSNWVMTRTTNAEILSQLSAITDNEIISQPPATTDDAISISAANDDEFNMLAKNPVAETVDKMLPLADIKLEPEPMPPSPSESPATQDIDSQEIASLINNSKLASSIPVESDALTSEVEFLPIVDIKPEPMSPSSSEYSENEDLNSAATSDLPFNENEENLKAIDEAFVQSDPTKRFALTSETASVLSQEESQEVDPENHTSNQERSQPLIRDVQVSALLNSHSGPGAALKLGIFSKIINSSLSSRQLDETAKLLIFGPREVSDNFSQLLQDLGLSSENIILRGADELDVVVEKVETLGQQWKYALYLFDCNTENFQETFSNAFLKLAKIVPNVRKNLDIFLYNSSNLENVQSESSFNFREIFTRVRANTGARMEQFSPNNPAILERKTKYCLLKYKSLFMR